MSKFKVLHIIGNRPHFMKLAPVKRALSETEMCKQVVVHTGQHYDRMLSSFFIEELGLNPPDYNLNIGSNRPLLQIAHMLIGLDEVLNQESPDIIVVYGDTNSTAAGAISASKNNIPLAHVEAGLREFSKVIPEEINKLLTDAVSDLLFSPTTTGIENLKKEGKTAGAFMTGDVGLDLILKNNYKIDQAESILVEYDLNIGEYIFMTCHREANTISKQHLENILDAANKINEKIVFSIHPRTKNAIKQFGLEDLVTGDQWLIIEPIGFFHTQAFIKNAAFTLTDSGGVIKESYFHKVPCIIIDKQTEWMEAVYEGWTHICGPDKTKIVTTANNISKPKEYKSSLGDGTASKQIAEIIVSYLNNLTHA